MKNIIILCLSLLSPLLCISQDLRTVKVTGEYSINTTDSDISPKKAWEHALRNAELLAIEKVNNRSIVSETKMTSNAQGENYESWSTIELSGEITDTKIIKQRTETRDGHIFYYCDAEITVRRNPVADPLFEAQVTGIKDIYASGEEFFFTVEPLQECWLYVFFVDEDNNSCAVYPNDYDVPQLLKAKSKYRFPDYSEIKLDKTEGMTIEHQKVVFLFTKKQQHFYNDEIKPWRETQSAINREIPPSERFTTIKHIKIE